MRHHRNCNEMSPIRMDCVEFYLMRNDKMKREWKQLKRKYAISNGQKKHISRYENSMLTSVKDLSCQNGSLSCRTLETWHVALLANFIFFIFWPQRMEYCGCTFYLWLVLGLTALTLSPAVRYYGKIGLFFSGSMILAILPIPQFILRPRDYRNAL